MLRKDREISETKQILEIIHSCKICRLAMCNENKPYLVPMNFGYIFQNDQLVLFFHCGKKGEKLNILKNNPSVFFEMDTEHRLIESEIPCQNGFAYASVMGNGTASFPTEFEEKATALNQIMLHQIGKSFHFNEQMTNSVTIIKVTVNEFTGKRREK